MAPTKKKGAKAPPAAAKARPARKAAAKTTGAANTKKQKTTATRSTGSKKPAKSKGGGRKKGGATATTTKASAGKKRKRDSDAESAAARAAAAESVAASVSTAIAAITTDDLKVVKKDDKKTVVDEKVTHNGTIVMKEWMDEDKENKRCIRKGFKVNNREDAARRKELFARLYDRVYKPLPRGAKFAGRHLRARDWLSKGSSANFTKLLGRTGLRPNTIRGDNEGQVSHSFATSNKFAIAAQQNVETGKGVAASLNITSTFSKDVIRLVTTGKGVTQQFDTVESALEYLCDALEDIVPDIRQVATLSPREYLKLCKSIDPNAAATTALNAVARRDARSLRGQSGACLQVAVRCIAHRMVERRVMAVIHRDGTKDLWAGIPEECLDPTCVGNQNRDNRDDCYTKFRSDGWHIYSLITQHVYRVSKGSPGVGTTNGHTADEEGMGWAPLDNGTLSDNYYLGQKTLPSLQWRECKDKNGNPTGRVFAFFAYKFYYDGGETAISVHQLGQLILRMLGGASRGPFMDVWLEAAGFEGRTVDEAFPIRGRGNQTVAYECKSGIPLDEQSEIPDVDHGGPRHEWVYNSLWYTLCTNHSRNIRFTTTRNGDVYPGNGTNDFNFAHLIMKYVPSHHLPTSKDVKASEKSKASKGKASKKSSGR